MKKIVFTDLKDKNDKVKVGRSMIYLGLYQILLKGAETLKSRSEVKTGARLIDNLESIIEFKDRSIKNNETGQDQVLTYLELVGRDTDEELSISLEDAEFDMLFGFIKEIKPTLKDVQVINFLYEVMESAKEVKKDVDTK